MCHAAADGLECGDGLLSSIVEINRRDDGEARVCENLAGFLNVRALESHNQRKFEARLLARRHNSVGHRRTVDNPAEDVDQNGLDLKGRIREEI